jgi:hypothetical protein
MEIQLHPFLTSSLDGSEYSAYILTNPPRGKELSTTKQKAGWVLQPVRMRWKTVNYLTCMWGNPEFHVAHPFKELRRVLYGPRSASLTCICLVYHGTLWRRTWLSRVKCEGAESVGINFFALRGWDTLTCRTVKRSWYNAASCSRTAGTRTVRCWPHYLAAWPCGRLRRTSTICLLFPPCYLAFFFPSRLSFVRSPCTFFFSLPLPYFIPLCFVKHFLVSAFCLFVVFKRYFQQICIRWFSVYFPPFLFFLI